MVAGIGMNAGIQQMNQTYGNTRQTGTVMQGLKEKYGCEDCFEHGPHFVHYPIPVQEVPRQVVKPSLWTRICNTFFGG